MFRVWRIWLSGAPGMAYLGVAGAPFVQTAQSLSVGLTLQVRAELILKAPSKRQYRCRVNRNIFNRKYNSALQKVKETNTQTTSNVPRP
jgi:hypothetical protein